MNGDGFADLIIGARSADGGPDNTPGGAGESYILFGGDFTGDVTQLGDETANTLTGSGAHYTATITPTRQAREVSFRARNRRGRAKRRTRFQVPPSRSLETRS